MYLPHLLRAAWPMIIGGLVLLFVSAILLTIVIPWFGLFKNYPLLRLLVWITPFAYPLVCWALFSWAGHHDRRIEESLRANGVVASATVQGVHDLGVDLNQNPLLKLQLRVAPPDAAPFDVEVYTVTSRLAMGHYSEAATVKVRYDPHDRSRFMLEE